MSAGKERARDYDKYAFRTRGGVCVYDIIMAAAATTVFVEPSSLRTVAKVGDGGGSCDGRGRGGGGGGVRPEVGEWRHVYTQ